MGQRKQFFGLSKRREAQSSGGVAFQRLVIGSKGRSCAGPAKDAQDRIGEGRSCKKVDRGRLDEASIWEST